MTTHVIRGVSLHAESGGYVIEYLTPEQDIRSNGLVLNHALLIPGEDAFLGLLDELEAALQQVLTAGLALHADSPALEIPAEDDLPGPYDNPGER